MFTRFYSNILHTIDEKNRMCLQNNRSKNKIPIEMNHLNEIQNSIIFFNFPFYKRFIYIIIIYTI